MDISVLLVTPGFKGSFIEELDDCVNQLKLKVSGNRVISTTLFLKAHDNGEYSKYKEKIFLGDVKIFNLALLINYMRGRYRTKGPMAQSFAKIEWVMSDDLATIINQSIL